MIPTASFAIFLLGFSSVSAKTMPEIEFGRSSPLARRIEDHSARFLGRPYVLGPLGEGPSGAYDKDPLYRFDVFDCTTFVETVMALSLAKDFGDFERLMNLIRYKDGVVSYVARNHFTDADWIANNVSAGLLRDITQTVAGKKRVEVATAVVDKAGWYRKMKLNEGQDIKPETVSLPYVGLDSIFTADGGIDWGLLDRIPSGAVGNVVRPNWDLTKEIGTRMNVSHQVLMIRKNGRLLVRQATSVAKKQVVDMDVIEFLRPLLQSSTIKGVNFLEVVEP